MLEEAEARRRIVAEIKAGPSVSVSLDEALGRIAGEDFFARVALPGFDNSQMDGYAVRAAEAVRGAVLPVCGEQPAGPDKRLTLEAGKAIRIFTGAPLPGGADAVLMQEDAKVAEENPAVIRVLEGVEPGEFVRRKGSDLCVGQKILAAGDTISAARIGVLASQGVSNLKTVRLPRFSVVTTGDELVSQGRKLGAGEIYNSNGPMLSALIREHAPAEVQLRHAPDEAGRLRATLEEAMEKADFVLVAGGVSVGEHDLVKGVLGDLGMEACFWRVRVKPGKPLLFGRRSDQWIFGLPGNPVSAYVTFLLFVLPAIRKWQGQAMGEDALPLLQVRARLAEPVWNRGERPHYFRVKLDTVEGVARPLGLQQSHALFSLSRTNALLRVAPETRLEEGEEVCCFLTGMKG